MRLNIQALALTAFLAACGGTDLPKKPDPYLTIRLQNQLDTTTRPGRATWHTYLLLTGPYTAQNGISPQGGVSLQDIRLGLVTKCLTADADSVGQRLLTLIALADTTTEQGSADATAQSIVTDWYNGNHNLPTGWMALSTAPADAWNSQQFEGGHGLVPSDPIKWDWTWTGSGATNFAERTDSDPLCSVY